jgi:hypothetical protein
VLGNRLIVKAGKRAAKFDDKMYGREEVHDTTGMLKRKKKNTGKKEGDREKLSEKRVCQ